MLRMRIRDVEVEDDDRCFAECEDEYGNVYKFPITYKKARIIALLLIDAYIPQNSIYEFVIKLFDETGFHIDSITINDGYKNKARISIKDYSSNEIKYFYLAIPDALILHLMSDSSLFIDKKAEFLLSDEIDGFFWYRFLKELDLC